MTDMTNFDKIRETAMELIEQESCPELAKEILIKAVADEKSLATFLNSIAILSFNSKAFAAALEKTMEMIDMKMAFQKIVAEMIGRDENVIVCNCEECRAKREGREAE